MILNLDHLFIHLLNNYNNKYLKKQAYIVQNPGDLVLTEQLVSSDNMKYFMGQMAY